MVLDISGIFDNAAIRNDGTVNVRVKFPSSEIPKYIKLIMTIGKQVKVIMVTEDGQKIRLGKIMFKSLGIDSEGEAKFNVIGDTFKDLGNLSEFMDKSITFRVQMDEPEEAGQKDE